MFLKKDKNMVAAVKKIKKIKAKIPEEWIYEIWDGKPVY